MQRWLAILTSLALALPPVAVLAAFAVSGGAALTNGQPLFWPAQPVTLTEAIGMPAEYLEPMKADPSWEKMTRYAHTLAYDGRIVQGTRDGAPLPPGRWSVTRPTEVAVGEGSPAAR